MADYKKMYFALFGACVDAMTLLQNATLSTEEDAMQDGKTMQFAQNIEEESNFPE